MHAIEEPFKEPKFYLKAFATVLSALVKMIVSPGLAIGDRKPQLSVFRKKVTEN